MGVIETNIRAIKPIMIVEFFHEARCSFSNTSFTEKKSMTADSCNV